MKNHRNYSGECLQQGLKQVPFSPQVVFTKTVCEISVIKMLKSENRNLQLTRIYHHFKLETLSDFRFELFQGVFNPKR